MIPALSYPTHNCLTVRGAMKQGGPEEVWADIRGTRLLAHVAQLSTPYVVSNLCPRLHHNPFPYIQVCGFGIGFAFFNNVMLI